MVGTVFPRESREEEVAVGLTSGGKDSKVMAGGEKKVLSPGVMNMEESQSVKNYGLELTDELPRDRRRVEVSVRGSMNYQYKGFIGGKFESLLTTREIYSSGKVPGRWLYQYPQVAGWARCAGEVRTVTDVG